LARPRFAEHEDRRGPGQREADLLANTRHARGPKEIVERERLACLGDMGLRLEEPVPGGAHRRVLLEHASDEDDRRHEELLVRGLDVLEGVAEVDVQDAAWNAATAKGPDE